MSIATVGKMEYVSEKTRGRSLMKEWQFWTLTGLGVIFVLLVLTNMYLFVQNRSMQREVNSRQQFIAQSVQLEQLNKEIIVALANLSVRDRDDELKQLLTAHGINVTANPKQTPGEPEDRAAAKAKK
jgi:hypothetical protein